MKTLSKLLLAFALATTMSVPSVQAQGEPSDVGTDVESPPPSETVAPTENVVPAYNSSTHAFVTVNGVHVFYYYDGAGNPIYYRLGEDGSRVYYPADWRPYYLVGGAMTYFTPVPYFVMGSRIVYYYNQGGAFRYYTNYGGRMVYYPSVWRPFYVNAGVRVYYAPRVRYSYSVWNRHRVYVRPVYYRNMTIYRTRQSVYWNRHYRRFTTYRTYHRRPYRHTVRRNTRVIRRNTRVIRRNTRVERRRRR